MFPWLGWWLKDRKVLMEGFKFTLTQIKQMIRKLRETLNLEERRGFVDSYLIHQQKIKVLGSLIANSYSNLKINSKKVTLYPSRHKYFVVITEFQIMNKHSSYIRKDAAEFINDKQLLDQYLTTIHYSLRISCAFCCSFSSSQECIEFTHIATDMVTACDTRCRTTH